MSRIPERRTSVQAAYPPNAPSGEEQGCRILPLPIEPASQFDTMETRFFKEGDDLCGTPTVIDVYDEPTSRLSLYRRKRKRLLGAAAAIGAVVVCAVFVAWRSPHKSSPPRPVMSITHTEPASVPPAPIVPAPAAPPSPTSPPGVAAGAVVSDSEAPADNSRFDLCKSAYDKHRGKVALTACAQAFADNPNSAEIAVMLARTEFDRGHARQALDWAKKALALDEQQADAYVFLGGAEQAAGHRAAAKTAYKRYLQLSPQGRYAADLRAVLNSL